MYGLSIALVFGYSNNNDLPNCNSRNTSPDYYVHHDYTILYQVLTVLTGRAIEPEKVKLVIYK